MRAGSGPPRPQGWPAHSKYKSAAYVWVSFDLASHTQSTTQALGNSSLPAHHQYDFHQQKKRGNSVGAPNVQGVTAHGEELARTAPIHRALLNSAATQSESRSASKISQRTRVSTTAIVYIQKAKIISIRAMIMVASIEVPLRMVMVAPWCSVFHHSTDLKMMGTLITPTIASSPLARAARRGSSIEAFKDMIPI